MRFSLSGILVGALAIACVVATPARAAIVYSGYTDGCFGTCTPTNTATHTTVSDTDHLHFSNATFSNITAGTLFDLGTFRLGNGTATYNEMFKLLVTFTLPALGGGNTFLADISGAVHGNSTGTTPLSLTFDTHQLAFNGFTLTVNDLTGISTRGDDGYELTGTITAAVPEASTWAMMLVGFAAIGFAALSNFSRSSAKPAAVMTSVC
jgi:hypothetical protein